MSETHNLATPTGPDGGEASPFDKPGTAWNDPDYAEVATWIGLEAQRRKSPLAIAALCDQVLGENAGHPAQRLEQLLRDLAPSYDPKKLVFSRWFLSYATKVPLFRFGRPGCFNRHGRTWSDADTTGMLEWINGPYNRRILLGWLKFMEGKRPPTLRRSVSELEAFLQDFFSPNGNFIKRGCPAFDPARGSFEHWVHFLLGRHFGKHLADELRRNLRFDSSSFRLDQIVAFARLIVAGRAAGVGAVREVFSSQAMDFLELIASPTGRGLEPPAVPSERQMAKFKRSLVRGFNRLLFDKDRDYKLPRPDELPNCRDETRIAGDHPDCGQAGWRGPYSRRLLLEDAFPDFIKNYAERTVRWGGDVETLGADVTADANVEATDEEVLYRAIAASRADGNHELREATRWAINELKSKKPDAWELLVSYAGHDRTDSLPSSGDPSGSFYAIQSEKTGITCVALRQRLSRSRKHLKSLVEHYRMHEAEIKATERERRAARVLAGLSPTMRAVVAAVHRDWAGDYGALASFLESDPGAGPKGSASELYRNFSPALVRDTEATFKRFWKTNPADTSDNEESDP